MKDIRVVTLQPEFRPAGFEEQWTSYERQLAPVLAEQRQSKIPPTLVVFPEYALGNALRGVGNKEQIDPTLKRAGQFARDHRVVLVGGSLAYNDGETWFNRSFVWDTRGRVVGQYDKQHLFRHEQKLGLTAGQGEEVVEVAELDARVQILICSDLWHPEHLRGQLGHPVDLVVVPTLSVVEAMNLTQYGRWLWHSLAVTRARENVTPLVVSDWAVQQMGQSWTSGASSITDPSVRWTTPEEASLAFDRFDEGQPSVAVGLINQGQVEKYRQYRRQAGLLPPTDEV